MAKRVTIKEGDIFKIIDDKHHRYFQFFYQDLNNLTSDLIWVFNCEEETDDIDKIVKSGYKFYMHTYIRIGIKLNCFEKIGSSVIPSEMQYIPKFRWTNNDLRYKIKDWYIVQGDKKTYVGEHLSDEEKRLPFLSPDFPKMAIETMIRGDMLFMKLG